MDVTVEQVIGWSQETLGLSYATLCNGVMILNEWLDANPVDSKHDEAHAAVHRLIAEIERRDALTP